tara:strand:- start:209 stop:469 length:261 start_codon:yes stop_codon:yes gene_type:complete
MRPELEAYYRVFMTKANISDFSPQVLILAGLYMQEVKKYGGFIRFNNHLHEHISAADIVNDRNNAIARMKMNGRAYGAFNVAGILA